METGLSYSCKNFGFEGPQNEIAHFINIPLSIKKDFFPSNRFVPYFKVGPDVTIVAAAIYKQIVENANRLPKGDQLAAPLAGYPDQKNEDGTVFFDFSLLVSSKGVYIYSNRRIIDINNASIILEGMRFVFLRLD